MPQRGLSPLVGSTLRPTTRQLLVIGLAYVLVVAWVGPYFHRLSPHASPHASPQTRSQSTWYVDHPPADLRARLCVSPPVGGLTGHVSPGRIFGRLGHALC